MQNEGLGKHVEVLTKALAVCALEEGRVGCERNKREAAWDRSQYDQL